MGSKLIVICALIVANVLQFLLGWMRSTLFASERDDFEQQAREALADLEECQLENAVLRFENECLKSRGDGQDAATRLLETIARRCDGKDQYAWRYRFDHDRIEGLGADAQHVPQITLTDGAKRRLNQLHDPSLQLSIHDFTVRCHKGQHVSELFAFPCGPRQVLLLSQLPGITGLRERDLKIIEQQCSLEAKRLSPQQRLTAINDDPDTLVELELAREMLELRTLTDHEFSTPHEMLETFLSRLAMLIGYERASLYLLEETSQERELFVWGGQALSEATTTAWLNTEAGLIGDHHPGIQESRTVTADRLSNHNSPFQTAVMTPAFHGSEEMGIVMLTSRRRLSPDDADLQLLHWAAEFIMQTLVRTLDRALIEDQARRDALTQLANRHAFEQEFTNIVQQTTYLQCECSLVLMDIDHFKKINDEYGHPAGDAALTQVAQQILNVISCLRVTDRPLLARYGGEEFALLLPNIGDNGAHRIAETIRQAIQETPISYEGIEINATLSAGVATVPQHAESSRELLSRADAALYHAKNNGRNRVEVASLSNT